MTKNHKHKTTNDFSQLGKILSVGKKEVVNHEPPEGWDDNWVDSHSNGLDNSGAYYIDAELNTRIRK